MIWYYFYDLYTVKIPLSMKAYDILKLAASSSSIRLDDELVL